MEGTKEKIIEVNKAKQKVTHSQSPPDSVKCPICGGVCEYNLFTNKYVCGSCGFKMTAIKVRSDGTR